MFQNISSELEDVKGGEVNMFDTIKCPKVLKYLNAKLPKKGDETCKSSKKIVSFASKQFIEEDSVRVKENRVMKKIRSEKVIKISDEDNLKAPRNHHQVKLPPVEK